MMHWKELQRRLSKTLGNEKDGWGKCPACQEIILNAVVVSHIEQVHPKIAEDLRRAYQ